MKEILFIFSVGVIVCGIAIFIKGVRGDYDGGMDDEYWIP